MKRNIKFIFLLSLPVALCALPHKTLLLSALNDDDFGLAEAIAGKIKDLDAVLNDSAVKTSIDDEYNSIQAFKAKVASQATGGGITKEEATKLLTDAHLTMPKIESKEQAAEALKAFFDTGNGGKLINQLAPGAKEDVEKAFAEVVRKTK